MKPVTDPNILAQLNGTSGGDLKPVTNPNILAQLNGTGNSVAAPAQKNVSDWTPTVNNLKQNTQPKDYSMPHYDPISLYKGLPEPVKEGADKAIQGLGPAEYAALEVPGMLAKPTTYALKAGKKLAGEGADLVSKATRPVGQFVRELLGSNVKSTQNEAGALAKATLETSAKADTQRVQALSGLRTQLDTHLDKFSAPNAKNTLDVQGNTLHDAFNNSMSSAKKIRGETADVQFKEALDVAKLKEAAGGRIDTSKVEASLNKMIDMADGIPDLSAGLNKMLSSVKGSPAAEAEASRILLPPGVKPMAPPAAPKGKVFEQAELTRRYLNDIAYSSDLEGYSEILRSEARTAAKSLEQAMGEFVPEFKTYKDNYKLLSEPLESLNTRFGKAITSTEGGIKEDAYSKVAKADLPNRLFSKKEGVDVMIEALAGGKNATAEARAQAAKQVDKMVENWIVESTRSKGPTSALKVLDAPNMQGTLSSAPNAKVNLTKGFGESAQKEADSKKLGDTVAGIGDRAGKMRTNIQMADELAALPGETSQQKAYEGYISALQTGRRAGIIPKQQYEAALQLIDRAGTVAEKSAKARRLVTRLAVGGLTTTGVVNAGNYFFGSKSN